MYETTEKIFRTLNTHLHVYECIVSTINTMTYKEKKGQVQTDVGGHMSDIVAGGYTTLMG